MKKLELYILIIGLFLCAFVSSHKILDVTLSSRYLVWVGLTIVLFISISYRALTNPAKIDFSILRRMIFPVFFGYLFFVILSFAHSVNVSETLYNVLKTFVMIVFLFEAVLILKENGPNALIKAMTVLALILSSYGIYQYCTVGFGYQIGTMSGRNLWSAAQFLLLPFCFYSLLTFGVRWKVISLAAIIMVVFNIITLLTRSVWLALFVSSLSVLVFRRKLLFYAGICFIFLVLSVCLLKDKSAFAGNLVERATDRQSPVERFQIWYSTLRLYKDNPVLGTGAGTWRIEIPRYGKGIASRSDDMMAFRNVYYQRPHNDFLWVLVETGTSSCICYLTIFALSFYYLYKANNRIALMVFAGLVGYMCFAFFSFPKERVFHSMILIIFMAISVAVYHKRKAHHFHPQTIYILSVFVLAVLSLAAVDFWFRYDSERIARKIVQERHFGRWENALIELERCSWFSTLDPISTPFLWYKGESEYMLGNIKKACLDFERANKYNPNHIFVLTNLGACQALLGQDAEAIENFKKALVLCPDFEGAKNNLNAVYAKLKGAKLWPQKPK